MKNRMSYDVDYDPEDRETSVLGALFRFLVYAVVGVLVLSCGLWLIGAVFGIAIGLLSLAITLAPFVIVGWLVWVIIRAILV